MKKIIAWIKKLIFGAEESDNIIIYHCCIDKKQNIPNNNTTRSVSIQDIEHLVFSTTDATSFTLIINQTQLKIYLILERIPKQLKESLQEYLPLGIQCNLFNGVLEIIPTKRRN